MIGTTDKYVGSKEYMLVYCALITSARSRTTIKYGDIAAIMGLPQRGNHMAKEVGIMLGEISKNEHTYGRPMLSVVVVTSDGKIGSGFFELAKYLGKLQDETEVGKQQFQEMERKAVYDAWTPANV
jgi:hypothetical protein